MAFPSSVPLYLDPPNWHHHYNHQPDNINQQAGAGINITLQGGSENPLHLPSGPPPPIATTTATSPQQPPTVSVQLPHHHVGGSGSIRPNSMVDQARQARLPQPEAGLNCPRCDSTNTKFCYFNNYSLTQPRHFCKTCRRYWTKGGALRNVPVGGGCRKNKKSRSKSKSKSKNPADERSSCSTASAAFPEMFVNHHLMGHESSTQLLPYNMASLQNQLGQQHYGNVDDSGGLNIFGSTAVGAGMGGGKVGVDFEACGDGGMATGEWRLRGQMEQFLGGGGLLEQPLLYPFHQSGHERNGVIGGRDLLGSKIHDDEVEASSAVKMEGESRQGLHLRSQILDVSDNGNHGGLYYDNSNNKYYLTDLAAADGLGICSTSGSSAHFFS